MTMKKYAAFFITALFVTSCNSERTIDSDLAASNLKGKIIKIEKNGLQEVYDIEVENVHNFLANGIVSHNCSLYPTT